MRTSGFDVRGSYKLAWPTSAVVWVYNCGDVESHSITLADRSSFSSGLSPAEFVLCLGITYTR